jgi:glutathione peroxidase
MHNELKDKGFEVMAFPSNQFGGQEPGTAQEINDFARGKYGAQFTIFEKIEVNGDNTHPVYNYLRTNSSLYDAKKKQAGNIPWNFAKFLVNAEGHVVNYYAPTVDPQSIRPDIEKLLM